MAQDLGVSLATLHRVLHEQRVQVLATGKASRTRYALRKPLRDDAADVPLYEVGVDGQANALAPLALVYPQGNRMDLSGSAWPLVDASRDGWWDGLPYPLYDMRPQGYLGRQMARAHHRPWAVSSNPDEWSDDHIVCVLSHSGYDVSGNLSLRPGPHPTASASQPPRAPEPGAGLRHAAHAVRALRHGAASNRHCPCRRSARTG